MVSDLDLYQQTLETITRTCLICGAVRQPAELSVSTFDVTKKFKMVNRNLPPGAVTFKLNYCNDREFCRNKAASGSALNKIVR